MDATRIVSAPTLRMRARSLPSKLAKNCKGQGWYKVAAELPTMPRESSRPMGSS
jgi:hypothetical protein